MVADEDDLRTCVARVLDQLVEVASAEHPGLIDDNHGPRSEAVLAAQAQLALQRRDAGEGDTGRLLDPARRASGHSGADAALAQRPLDDPLLEREQLMGRIAAHVTRRGRDAPVVKPNDLAP